MTATIVWSHQASRQYLESLRHIASEDWHTAQLMELRVEKSLKLLMQFPNLGSLAAVAGVRAYPVPRTGHSFDYRVVRHEIRIQRWYRQRQRSA